MSFYNLNVLMKCHLRLPFFLQSNIFISFSKNNLYIKYQKCLLITEIKKSTGKHYLEQWEAAIFLRVHTSVF